jgi:hypothetical protein
LNTLCRNEVHCQDCLSRCDYGNLSDGCQPTRLKFVSRTASLPPQPARRSQGEALATSTRGPLRGDEAPNCSDFRRFDGISQIQAGAKLEGLHPTGVEQHNTRRAAPHLYMVLFRSLMIVVNAVTDDFCRFCHERWVEILVGRKLGERRFIARQHAVEYTRARVSNLQEVRPPLCSQQSGRAFLSRPCPPARRHGRQGLPARKHR